LIPGIVSVLELGVQDFLDVVEIIYINGELLSGARARVSPFDRGFLYGYGLFETMRAYNGYVFRLDSHLTRLGCSAESIGLAHSALTTQEGKQSLKAACASTLEANELTDARIRLTVSAGEGDMNPDARTFRPTILITARTLDPLPPEKYEMGFKAAKSFLRRNSQSPLSRLKSTCYLENILARTTARASGYDEAIFLNELGYLAEGSTTNVFLVSNEGLITPSFDSGILPGITREVVLEIARSMDVEACERPVEVSEMVDAEEAFLTNSILEIMPLTQFEGKPIGTGKPGQLTRKFMTAYRKLVNEASKS
jgi:branched-chain amino acid aminotransferase group I